MRYTVQRYKLRLNGRVCIKRTMTNFSQNCQGPCVTKERLVLTSLFLCKGDVDSLGLQRGIRFKLTRL